MDVTNPIFHTEKASNKSLEKETGLTSPDKDLEKLHAEALKRFDNAKMAEKDQRDQALEDIKFAHVRGAQWNADERKKWHNRPRFEMNKVGVAVRRIVGGFGANIFGIKVRPVSAGATGEVAETYAGIIRSMQQAEGWTDAVQGAFKEMVGGGFGAWQVATRYCDDTGFEQELYLKPIRSATTSVHFDPAAKLSHGTDAGWAFVSEEISLDEYRAKWPNKPVQDFDDGNTAGDGKGWFSDTKARIADYWLRVPYKKTVAQLSDGRVMEVTEKTQMVIDELAQMGITVAQQREIPSHRIEYYKISGSTVLEGPIKWPGKHIPIIGLHGFEQWVEGKRYYKGIVRDTKDAQRIVNFSTSAKVQAISMSPISPLFATPDQIRGYEHKYRKMGASPDPVMLYNPTPETGNAPPQRLDPPAPNMALIQAAQQAEQDLQTATGLFDAALGNAAAASGTSLTNQQAAGDANTQELLDEVSSAMTHTGRILVDMIGKIYDTQRQLRIIGADGQEKFVEVNQSIVDAQTGEVVVINDLAQGKYDMTVALQPNFATKKQENLQLLSNVAMNSPQLGGLVGDLIAKNIDGTFGEELERRVRKQMLMQGLIEPNEEEQKQMAAQQPQEPDPMQVQQMIAVQLNNELLAAQVDEKELSLEKTRAEVRKLEAEAVHKLETAETQAVQRGKDLAEFEAAQVEALRAASAEVVLQGRGQAALQGGQPQEAPQPPVLDNPEMGLPAGAQAVTGELAPEMDAGLISPEV